VPSEFFFASGYHRLSGEEVERVWSFRAGGRSLRRAGD